MAYGIIRVRNISAGGTGNTETHNERQYEKKEMPIPENINPELTPYNVSYVRGMKEFKGQKEEREISYQEAIETRFQEAGVKPRKNSVHAIEFMISASKDFFQDWTDPKTGKNYRPYDEKSYLYNSIHWLEDRYGKDNVVAWSIHMDESTPHVHAIVTPIVQKEVNWKNRNGEGTKIENRLVAREITGGPDKLRKLQDDFHGHVSKRYEGFAIWYRGTLVEHQLKEYTKTTNHEIGKLRDQLLQAQNDAAEIIRIQNIINQKQKEMEEKTAELQKKIEIRKDRNKGEGWKKGQEFAHDKKLLDKKEPLIKKPGLFKPKPKGPKLGM